MMRAFIGVLLALGCALASSSAMAQSQTSFTYQGRLDDGGAPANGVYDIRFTPWNVASGPGATLAPSVCFDDVDVIDGLFQVEVDFSAGAAWLSAANVFLQIDVRPDETSGNCGTGTYTALLPRTRLTSAPRSATTRGITVSQDGKVGLGGATPDRGLTMWGGINVRDSGNQGVYLLTDELVIANADTEDQVYRYDAPPLDRHTFFAGASPALSIDSVGRVGIGLETPEAPVHVRSLINRGNSIRLQGSRQISNQGTPNGPSTAAAVSVGSFHGPWSNVDSARVPDGVSATSTPTLVSQGVGYQTATLTFSGFGFAIPADRTIVGIAVEVVTSNSIAFACADSVAATMLVKPVSGQVIGTTEFQSVPVNSAFQVVAGGASSLFGASWTPALINSPSFSIDVISRTTCSTSIQGPFGETSIPCSSCGPTGQFRIDGVRVIVYTSTSAPVTESFNWSMGSSAGQSAFSIAPSPDLSNPILSMTTDGRMGVGVVPNTSTPLTTRLQVAGNVQCLSLIETSTARFKTDVSALESPLDTVLALKPVRFRWDHAHGGRDDIGLLAEQVREVAPALVATGEGGEASGLNYGRVGVLAVGAIQAQQKIIDQQCAHVRALELQNAELTARLDRLEAALRRLEVDRTNAALDN